MIEVGITWEAMEADCLVCEHHWIAVAPLPYITIDDVQEVKVSGVHCPACDSEIVELSLLDKS